MTVWHCHVQESLEKEQQALQDQLKKALQLHLSPKTSVDTATVADKIITMFDDMIQVRSEVTHSIYVDKLLNGFPGLPMVQIRVQGML